MGFLDDRDLEAVGEQLGEWLSTRLPSGATNVTVGNVEAPLGTGFSSDTLLFDLSYEDAGADHALPLVARLEPTEYIVFPDYDIALQHRVLSLLADTDVPVPAAPWIEKDGTAIGQPFYIMERVKGRVPSDNPPMHDEGWIAEELSESDREEMWWNGIDAMCAVHRVDWRALGFDFLLEPERGKTLLDQQLHYYEEYFTWAGDRSRHPRIEWALDYLHSHKPADEHVAICWGDSRLANQIFDGNRCAALLDWEMVRLGDPVQDLAWWLASDRCFTEGLEIPRLAGFPSRDETIAHWEKKTGLSAEHFSYYEVLALMRFSINMARIGQHMKKIELIDEENDFDVENLATITLERAMNAL